jgi:hypothetical protein
VQSLGGARMPVQTGVDWLSIVPIAESRSSYNGLLVFIFIAISGMLAATAIHRRASDKLRRGPAWDCGYPDGNPITDDFNPNHVHHRGISWMWPVVVVDGKTYDLWTVGEIRQRFVRWTKRETTNSQLKTRRIESAVLVSSASRIST